MSEPKLRIRVVCQNGHEAWSYFERRGLDIWWRGVPREEQCDCPKADFGEGYRAAGPLEAITDE